MATLKQIADQLIIDLKANAADRDQLFDWYGKIANRLAQRAQRLQVNTSGDANAYLTQEKTAFDAFRAAKEADRIANGETEE